jgi:YggT family protein
MHACRVVLCWFPQFDWDRNPWRGVRQVTDPYLNIFTGLVPPLLGTLDLTPLLGFFVLQWVGGYLHCYGYDDIETWW